MKRSSKLRNAIVKDCAAAMKTTTPMHILADGGASVLSVYTAAALGTFADAVFAMDIELGIQNIGRLLLCVMIAVIVIPLIGLCGNLSMFRAALIHDRMVLGRFLDKQYQSVVKLDPGDVQYRLEWDPCNLRCQWVLLWVNAVAILATAVVLIGQLYAIDWRFIAVIAALMLLKLCVPLAVKRLEARYDRETREYRTRVRTCETDITEKPYTVKMFGLAEPLVARLDAMYRQYYRTVFTKNTACTVTADAVLAFLDTFCVVVILFVGAAMVTFDMVTAGDVAAMVGYFSALNGVISQAGYIIRTIPLFKTTLERMEMLYMDAEPQAQDSPLSGKRLWSQGLSFSFGEHTVFEGIDVDIAMGDTVAVSGANGSGKSTLIKVLCGLYKPAIGDVMLEDIASSCVAPDTWRHLFSYVEQDVYLFTGTVRDNVGVGNPSAGAEQVTAVMQELGIIHLQERRVSMNQHDLSGGEKQRIAIARAMLKNAPFLIMDEPDNHLDARGLAWLEHFLRTTPKTVILITHDERLMACATKHIVLSKG